MAAPAVAGPAVVRVELTMGEVLIAAQAGLYRRVQDVKVGRRNFNGAGDEDPWRIDINGALGECAVAKWLGRYWQGMALGDLRGPDVSGGIQVRWAGKPTHRLIVQPKDPDDQPVVLVSGEPPTFTMHGWLRAGEAKRQEWWSDPKGGRPAWFVPQESLRPMPELRSLVELPPVAR